MQITKWEMLQTAEMAMIKVGVETRKMKEVLKEMERITESIDSGTKARLKERRGRR